MTWWDRLAPQWRERLAVNVAAGSGLEQRITQEDCSVGHLRREGIDGSGVTEDEVLALEALTLNREQITTLRPMRPLERLRVLDLSHNRLESLTPIEGMPLEYLQISGCGTAKLDSLATLPTLRALLSYGVRVRDISPLRACLELRRLALSSGTAFEDLTPLGALEKLEHLTLDRGTFTDLTPLAGLHALHTLDIGYNDITDLEPLGNLSLHTLDIAQTKVSTVEGLAPLETLRALSCYWTPLSSLEPIAGRLIELDCALDADVVRLFPNLERVRFRQKNLGDASALASATTLRSLTIDWRLKSLEPVAALTSLEALELGDGKIRDLSPLAGLRRLRRLELRHTKVDDLTPLSRLTDLEELDIWDSHVSDLSPLAGLEKLRFLSIRDTPVKSLEPLLRLPSLEHLIVDLDHPDLDSVKAKVKRIEG